MSGGNALGPRHVHRIDVIMRVWKNGKNSDRGVVRRSLCSSILDYDQLVNLLKSLGRTERRCAMLTRQLAIIIVSLSWCLTASTLVSAVSSMVHNAATQTAWANSPGGVLLWKVC